MLLNRRAKRLISRQFGASSLFSSNGYMSFGSALVRSCFDSGAGSAVYSMCDKRSLV